MFKFSFRSTRMSNIILESKRHVSKKWLLCCSEEIAMITFTLLDFTAPALSLSLISLHMPVHVCAHVYRSVCSGESSLLPPKQQSNGYV